MSGLEEAYAALVGYLSVPLVSLAVRHHWSTRIKVLLAAAVSAVASLGLIAAAPVISALGWEISLSLGDFRLLFVTTFAVQQATYKFQIPGAGSPDLNASLEAVGSPDEVYADDADDVDGAVA